MKYVNTILGLVDNSHPATSVDEFLVELTNELDKHVLLRDGVIEKSRQPVRVRDDLGSEHPDLVDVEHGQQGTECGDDLPVDLARRAPFEVVPFHGGTVWPSGLWKTISATCLKWFSRSIARPCFRLLGRQLSSCTSMRDVLQHSNTLEQRGWSHLDATSHKISWTSRSGSASLQPDEVDRYRQSDPSQDRPYC